MLTNTSQLDFRVIKFPNSSIMTSDAQILRRVGKVIRRPSLVVDRIAWLAARYRNYREMKVELAEMRKQYWSRASFNEQVDVVLNHKVLGAVQKPREIIGLLQMLQKDPPRYVCEIGTASGGTLFLLAQVSRPDALLLSVDLGLTRERTLVHARFANRKQRIISVRGDSRAPETIARVRRLLRGKPLDLLFIDGDHTYEGVKADFVNYSPLVRKGGLIVFHDIVTDFQTRYGKQIPNAPYTGDVPVFWQEIKAGHKTSEIIEDPEQDGYGIGIVYS